MKRKLLTLLFAVMCLAMVFCMSACGEAEDTADSGDTGKVLILNSIPNMMV